MRSCCYCFDLIGVKSMNKSDLWGAQGVSASGAQGMVLGS